MGVAESERRELVELLERVGPDAPTLCDGWRTRELAAHLVLRERRPDAAIGIVVPPMANWTERVQEKVAARPWPELVDTIRKGPPTYSIFSLSRVDELVNTAEYFVHHEDVRRAQPGWEPRPPETARDDAVWSRLRQVSRLAFRGAPVGVAFARPGSGELAVVNRGPHTVTVSGEPGELLLFAFGRTERRIEFTGDEADIAVVQGLRLGL